MARRHEGTSRPRLRGRQRGALALGLLLTVAALLPPVSALAERRLSYDMALEMLLLAVAVPLLAYGAGARMSRCPFANVHPIGGIVALNIAVFVAQLPPVVDAAARDPLVREVVLLGFVAAAFVFWCPIVGQSRLSSIAKLGVLMVASVPPTIPGITMALSHHHFYRAFPSIEDQQVAGLLLFGTAKLALVGGTFVVLWKMLTPDADSDDRDDGNRPVDDLPPVRPDWLRRLNGDLPEEKVAYRRRTPVADRELSRT